MKTGRKTSYDPNTFPLLAEQYARNGLSDKQIAKNLGISQASFYLYLKEFPEFLEALARGKKPVDIEVENALLKRALGFEFEEKCFESEIDKDGGAKIKSIKTTKKHIPPDVAAISFWLKNRKPGDWKEKSQVEAEITINPFLELMKKASVDGNEDKPSN